MKNILLSLSLLTGLTYSGKLSGNPGIVVFEYSEAQISGCSDRLATNYDPLVTDNDGSCLYDPVTVSALSSWGLPEVMKETSGLIIWDNKIWTHNDNTDINIYAFDTIDVYNYDAYPLTGAVNIDWEEISQDANYVYIGDFGNNYNGNRTDLKILRIEKSSILTKQPVIDTINFSYSLQTDFSPTGPNNTDFDCEAFIVTTDSIYLFTKEWVSNKTSVYSIPKTPGSYIADYQFNYNIEGLITGATFLEDEALIVLCGYNLLLQPFLFILYDFNNNNFFSGNKRRISINLPFHQVEGITTKDGLVYYISNEKFSHSVITVNQQLHKIDLTNYLNDYLNPDPLASIAKPAKSNTLYFPNPVKDYLHIKFSETSQEALIYIHNAIGQVVKIIHVNEEPINLSINVSDLSQGIYYLTIKSDYMIDKLKWIKN